jgi:hypothetical protein
MAKRRSTEDAGAKQDEQLERARREIEIELSKQTPHEQRAWREFELVFNVFATPRIITLKPDVSARLLTPSGLRQLKRSEAQFRSHVNKVLVYALDVYCEACGLLLSTREHAKIAGVTHTTIARIRAQIRRNPEAYEATRRLYLRHARSGRPGFPKQCCALPATKSFPL